MSNKISCLIPAPTRYNTGIMDTSRNGLLAYGYRFNVVVLNIREQCDIHASFEFHQEKVACLSFCKHKNITHLVVGGEDGALKIWDVENRPVLFQSFVLGKMRINSVKWKPDSDYIGYIAYDRMIMEWDTLRRSVNPSKIFSVVKDEVLVLECCAMEPNILAAGYRKGIVAIYDTLNGKCLHQLFHRDQSIISISWSPHSSSQLLSTSSDGNIFTWTLSNHPTHEVYTDPSTRKDGKTMFAKLWKTAIWHPLVPDSVLISNYSGDIYIHKTGGLPRKKNLSCEGRCHSRMVCFILACSFKREMLMSFAADSQMAFWDLNTNKCISKMFLIYNPVRTLQFCPSDESQLIVASNDMSLRIWSVASNCDVKILYNVSKTRVVYVAWHPEIPQLLGFATEEGRVGIYNVDRHKHGSFFTTTKHSGMIYNLSWGPFKKFPDPDLKNTGSDLCLFSCGGGYIYINHPSNLEKDNATTCNFDDYVENHDATDSQKITERTEVSWKHDYTMVAIGNQDGFVDVYEGKTLRHLAVLQGSRKTVNYLQWHPQHISISDTKCSMHNWLAVATAETDVCVYDLAVLSEHLNDENTSVLKISEPTRVLKGHTDRVTEVKWSMHVAGRLASASLDRTVQIWDVLSAQPIVNFQGHIGRVLSIEWSTLDPDVMYSGGDDNMVLKWRISEQVELKPPGRGGENKGKRKKKKKVQATNMEILASENIVNSPDSNGEEKEQESAIKSNENVGDNAVNGETDEDSKNKEHVEPIQASHWRKKEKMFRKKSFFPNFHSALSQKEEDIINNTIQVIDVLSGDKKDIEKLGEGDLAAFGYFGNQSTALAAFDADTNKLAKSGNHDVMHAVWKGDAGKTLRDAAETGQLNDYHIAISPMVSHSLWHELCEKYVVQLTKMENYFKAASYLIMIHKVYDAIHLIEKYIGPKEAFLLARIRLSHSDPLVTELIQKWCKQCLQSDQHVAAALCHLVENDPVSASKVLFRKTSAGYARLASYISLKYGHYKDSKYYALQCLKRIACRRESEVLSDVISDHPELEGLQVLVDINDSICDSISSIQKDKSHENWGLIIKILQNENVTQQEEVTIWKSYVEDDECYLLKLFSSIITAENFTDREDLASTLEIIQFLLKEEQNNYHAKEAMYIISLNVLACLYSLLIATSDDEILASFRYICNALALCLDGRLTNEFKLVSIMFFPFDIIQTSNSTHGGSSIVFRPSVFKSGSEVLRNAMRKLSEGVNKSLTKFYTCSKEGPFIYEEGELSSTAILDQVTSSGSVVDILLGFFSINFVECMWQQCIAKSIKLWCDDSVTCSESKHIKKDLHFQTTNTDIAFVNETVTGSSATDSVTDGALESSRVDPKEPVNGENDSECVTLTSCLAIGDAAVETLSEAAVETLSEAAVETLSEAAVETSSEAAVETSSEAAVETSSEAAVETSSEGQTNIFVSDIICDQENHVEQNGKLIPSDPHARCKEVIDLFFRMLNLFSFCSCKDVFSITSVLKSMKEKAGVELVTMKMKTKQVNVSELPSLKHISHPKKFKESSRLFKEDKDLDSKDIAVDANSKMTNGSSSNENIGTSSETVGTYPSVEEVCSEMTADQEIKTSSLPVENQSNICKENGDVRNEACKDTASIDIVHSKDDIDNCSASSNKGEEDLQSDSGMKASVETTLVEMESRIELMVKMLADIEEQTKGYNFPDGILAAKEIKELCDHVANKVSCPVLKPMAMEFSKEISQRVKQFEAFVDALIKMGH